MERKENNAILSAAYCGRVGSNVAIMNKLDENISTTKKIANVILPVLIRHIMVIRGDYAKDLGYLSYVFLFVCFQLSH